MAGFMQNSMENNPKIPPPPAEVGVRTMASDIEAVKASGGQPQFVSTPMPKMEARAKIPTAVWAIGAIFLAIAFALVGYFVLPSK